MFLEAEESKIKAVADSVSGEGSFTGSLSVIFSLCAHMVEELGSNLQFL
jgi:hypothetical protein